MRRQRHWWAGALTLVALVAIWAPVAVAGSPDAERQFFDLMTGERSAHSLGAYAVADDLADVARRHAARMAAENRLHHNPNPGDEVQDWEMVGENVGRGPSVEAVHRAFM